MSVTHADGFTILQPAIRTAELPPARHSRIFPRIGSARNAGSAKTTLPPNSAAWQPPGSGRNYPNRPRNIPARIVLVVNGARSCAAANAGRARIPATIRANAANPGNPEYFAHGKCHSRNVRGTAPMECRPVRGRFRFAPQRKTNQQRSTPWHCPTAPTKFTRSVFK